jgi:hypothetical protein
MEDEIIVKSLECDSNKAQEINTVQNELLKDQICLETQIAEIIVIPEKISELDAAIEQPLNNNINLKKRVSGGFISKNIGITKTTSEQFSNPPHASNMITRTKSDRTLNVKVFTKS